MFIKKFGKFLGYFSMYMSIAFMLIMIAIILNKYLFEIPATIN